jgi:hypothetical protein
MRHSRIEVHRIPLLHHVTFAVIEELMAAFLFRALAFLGWSSTRTRDWTDRIAASGSQVWVNNILIIALAVHMNQPLDATLSVFYLIPLYGFVVVFSVLANRVEPASVTGKFILYSTFFHRYSMRVSDGCRFRLVCSVNRYPRATRTAISY